MLNEIREKTERLIRRIRVRRCEVPFVILFSERSGSSHLCSLLDNHPEIVCRREDFTEQSVGIHDSSTDDQSIIRLGDFAWSRRLLLFQGKVRNDPGHQMVIKHFHDIYACRGKSCGFKFKFQIQLQLYPEVLRELNLLNPRLRVIALQRRNVLKQAISRQNMLRIQQLTSGDCNLSDSVQQGTMDEKFQLDIPLVLRYARFLSRQTGVFQESVQDLAKRSDFPALHLTYEDLLSDKENQVRKAFQYLEVDPDVPVYSAIHKSTADDLSQVISNFEELRSEVQGTKFESML